MSKIKKVVLAYSGGLDTSIMIPWLKEHYDCEVIAFAADLGQEEELTGLPDKAKETGALKCFVEDLTREFVLDYLWPMVQSGAIYEGRYLLGTSIARPLIAKRQIEIALAEGADAVAHGATGKGNDQVRFELTYMSLAPQLKIIAPWKDDQWTILSREDALDYAKKRNIPVAASSKKIYSRDRNIWHISHEGGELEDPWNAPTDDLLMISESIANAPDQAELIELDFDNGIPVALRYAKEKHTDPVTIIKKLNKIGGRHAIGQADLVENRLVGMKSRGVYETPGGTILYAAHQILESLVLDKDTYHYKEQIALRFADLIYNGQWFSPLREALSAFILETQKNVQGTVRLKLFKGQVIPQGVRSPYSLYSEDLATFGAGADYDQKDAIGFIRLLGLPLKIRHHIKQGKK